VKELVRLFVEDANILDLCVEGDKLIEEGTSAAYNKSVKGVKVLKNSCSPSSPSCSSTGRGGVGGVVGRRISILWGCQGKRDERGRGKERCGQGGSIGTGFTTRLTFRGKLGFSTRSCARCGVDRCAFVERACSGGGDDPGSISPLLFTVQHSVSEVPRIGGGARGKSVSSSILLLLLSVRVGRHRVRVWQRIKG
jgi:hypothetical protein